LVINRQKQSDIWFGKRVHHNKDNRVNTFTTSFLTPIAAQEMVIGRFSKAIQGF
jgi:hypothetical protein